MACTEHDIHNLIGWQRGGGWGNLGSLVLRKIKEYGGLLGYLSPFELPPPCQPSNITQPAGQGEEGLKELELGFTCLIQGYRS